MRDASPRAAVLGLALAFALPAAAGCASGYATLRSEAEIPGRVALLREAAEIPVRVRRIEAGVAGGTPYSLAVEERGTGDRERVLVHLHGLLADRSTWRFGVGDLGREHDVVLPDLPGCGESDSPEPGDFATGPYSPDGMAAAVLRVLREVLRDRPREPRVTLVGHSLGTSVILRILGSPALAEEFADVLRHVDRAVLFAPVDFAVEKGDPVFDGIANLGSLKVALADAFGALESQVVRANVDGVADPADLPREEVDRMLRILRDPPRRRAVQSMIRGFLGFDAAGRPDWDRVEGLVADYERVRVPVLLVCGARDETLPPGMGFKLRQQLPFAWLRIVPRARHGLPVERPRECARLVRGFVADGGRGWAAFETLPPDEGGVGVATAGPGSR